MCPQATRNMAQLASEMRQIKSFLHVSTAYVNCHLGRNVHVEERQYPFSVDGRPVAHADIIAELAALPADDAERRVRMFICPLFRTPCWGFRALHA